MFEIKNKTIILNRGEAGQIRLVCNEDKTFVAGDKITFSVVAKDNFTNVVFQKDFEVEEDCSEYVVKLTSDDTKIGSPIKSGNVTYWYEIKLNGETTLIGYDKAGPKSFILYPDAPRLTTD